MSMTNEDIYEYQFTSLFKYVKSLIGRDTIKVYETLEEEQDDKELDELIGESKLLFDVSGRDFKWFKTCESEYRYWVEVYVLKIIENMLKRARLPFEEKYYADSNEQHSIIYDLNGKSIEAYFLYDIEYEEANRSDYDKIADVLISKATKVDKIEIYIFRDCISSATLAALINGSDERNANGFVEVLPLHCFFDTLFGKDEYNSFCKYANAFHEKCNSNISYKTVITPTKRTLESFKKKKSQMLRDMDYLAIANKGQSGELSDQEFAKVKNSYLNNKMYVAMVSSNDFADSFISAEWSYDVYFNAMGELELTGIIAGYLKSIEQLMYKIVRFHKNQGVKIKTSEGFKPYTSDNEDIIDSTLWSLNCFLTSPQGKFAQSAKIRGCIYKAVDLWRQYQRNGYFHKHNLYAADNKISEVRELTLYLYFLILGGIHFSPEERLDLGACELAKSHSYNENYAYRDFEKWVNNILIYDLPAMTPGLWILLVYKERAWTVQPYLMKYFYIDDFESGTMQFSPDNIEMSHTRDIPSYKLNFEENNYISASLKLQDLFDKYWKDNPQKKKQIGAIILGIDKYTQLIHFN